MAENRQKELIQVVTEHLPDTILLISHLEHQIDLLTIIIKDLSTIVDQTKITEKTQERLTMLDGLLTNSSVNFDDLNNPLEAYKIPKTQELKNQTRKVQERYLKKQIDEGLFGK